jgi:hypothetical protein
MAVKEAPSPIDSLGLTLLQTGLMDLQSPSKLPLMMPGEPLIASGRSLLEGIGSIQGFKLFKMSHRSPKSLSGALKILTVDPGKPEKAPGPRLSGLIPGSAGKLQKATGVFFQQGPLFDLNGVVAEIPEAVPIESGIHVVICPLQSPLHEPGSLMVLPPPEKIPPQKGSVLHLQMLQLSGILSPLPKLPKGGANVPKLLQGLLPLLQSGGGAAEHVIVKKRKKLVVKLNMQPELPQGVVQLGNPHPPLAAVAENSGTQKIVPDPASHMLHEKLRKPAMQGEAPHLRNGIVEMLLHPDMPKLQKELPPLFQPLPQNVHTPKMLRHRSHLSFGKCREIPQKIPLPLSAEDGEALQELTLLLPDPSKDPLNGLPQAKRHILQRGPSPKKLQQLRQKERQPLGTLKDSVQLFESEGALRKIGSAKTLGLPACEGCHVESTAPNPPLPAQGVQQQFPR